MDPRGTIVQLARERLDGFRAHIREDGTYSSRVYPSLRSLVGQISREYGNRFLFELIQNGYDAHPQGSMGGEVAVSFHPEEGENGVLYVANRGVGFTLSNVEALCDVGLSDKPLREAIGNKGLGFRSVLAITADPEIYSRHPSSNKPGFDGFCFRFAHDEDFDGLLDRAADQELAKRDLPAFQVPIPIDPPAAGPVADLGRRGFETVVRLPLLSGFARDSVSTAIEELKSFPVPFLAFLRKLSRLSFEVIGNSSLSFSWTRDGRLIPARTVGQGTYELAELGEWGRFLVCWSQVPEARVLGAIESSIERQQLDDSWRDWSGDGELAVAVPIGTSTVRPHIYTFLPMGTGAEAPFAGLLHGSFYPNANRTALDASVPLNQLYLREALEVAATTVSCLRSGSLVVPGIDPHELGQMVVDLMTWGPAEGITNEFGEELPEAMAGALEQAGMPVATSLLLPVLGHDGQLAWASCSEASTWAAYGDNHVLTIPALVRHGGVQALPPGLGQERTTRLGRFLAALGLRDNLDPSLEQQAAAIEAVAMHLARTPGRADQIRGWSWFYIELAPVLEGTNRELWADRSILFCSDGKVHSAGVKEQPIRRRGAKGPRSSPRQRSAVAIFVPPSGRRTGVLAVPKPLQKFFAFLSPDLDWGNELDTTQRALERLGLAHRYEAEAIVASISDVVGRQRSPSIERAALLWVFNLWRLSRSTEGLLARAALRVPTQGGRWEIAERTFFSRGWPAVTLGSSTHALLEHAVPAAREFAAMRRRLLASPRAAPFNAAQTDDWSEFLDALGVQSGITVELLNPTASTIAGWALSLDSICKHLGVGPKTQEYMREELGREPEIRFSGTNHRLPYDVPYIPGQEDFDLLDSEAKALYAELILAKLPTMPTDRIWIEAYSESRPVAGSSTWPSPAISFLHRARWFALEGVGTQSKWSLVRAGEVLLESESGERFPVYLPRPTRALRGLLRQDSVRSAFVSLVDAAALGEAASLPVQIQLLARAYADPAFPVVHQRAFENLYWRLWAQFVTSADPPDWRWLGGDQTMALKRNGELSPIQLDDRGQLPEMGGHHEDVYVRDIDDDLKSGLLAQLGFLIWDAGPAPASRALLVVQSVFGSAAKSMADVELEVLLDGLPAEETVGQRASDCAPAFSQIVARCLASLTGVVAQQLGNWIPILERADHLEFKPCASINIRIQGRSVSLPQEWNGSLDLAGLTNPSVLVEIGVGRLDWAAMKRAARAIAGALRHASVHHQLLLAFTELEASGVDLEVVPSPALMRRVDRALQLSDEESRRATAAATGDIEWKRKLLSPLVLYYGDDEMLRTFVDGAASSSSEILQLACSLIPVASVDQRQLGVVVDEAHSFEDLLNELELDLARFNRALVELGESPITYPDIHRNAIELYRAEHYEEIMRPARAAYMPAFKAFGDMSGFRALRDGVESLEPPEDWLLYVRQPEEHMLTELFAHLYDGLSSPIPPGKNLPPVARLRESNHRRTRDVVRRAKPVVRAWSYRNSSDAGSWGSDDGERLLVERLRREGVFDFAELDEHGVLRWLVVLESWPAGMPPTLSLRSLKLRRSDLDQERQREMARRREKERQQRSVAVLGVTYDSAEMDIGAASEQFERLVLNTTLSASLTPSTTLRPPGKGRLRGPARTKRGPGQSPSRLSSQQADLVGFLGELAVYHWLKRLLRRQDVDRAWVSRNRERLLGGQGDDGTGYDFEIFEKRRRVHLEVKSHLGDPLTIELGETEVTAAQQSTQRGSDYRIVYVSGLQDLTLFNIEVLPNPLSEEGRRLFNLEGQGLRYRFAR